MKVHTLMLLIILIMIYATLPKLIIIHLVCKFTKKILVRTVTWRIFTTLLSRFGERIFTIKSPLLAASRKILHLSVQGHLYFCIIYLFLLLSFFHAKENYAFVVSSPRRSIQHQLKIMASSWDHLPKLRILLIVLAS